MNLIKKIAHFAQDFCEDESGVTAIEYGILAAGVAVVIGALVASDGTFSSTMEKLFDSILDQLPQKTGGSGSK